METRIIIFPFQVTLVSASLNAEHAGKAHTFRFDGYHVSSTMLTARDTSL